MSMEQTYQANKQDRLLIEHFLLFLSTLPGEPRLVLCEHTALAGWFPSTRSHTELIDQFQGIDRAQLDQERHASTAAGGACAGAQNG